MSDALTPWLAATEAAAAGTSAMTTPRAAGLATGGFALVWIERPAEAGALDAVRAAFFDAGGRRTGEALLHAGEDVRAIDIAADGAGGFLLAVAETTATGARISLGARSGAGAAQAAAPVIDLPGAGVETVSLARNAAGEVEMVWSLVDGAGSSVHGALYTGWLSPLAAPQLLVADDRPSDPALGPGEAQVVAMPSGHFGLALIEPDADQGVQLHTLWSSAYVANWGKIGSTVNLSNTSSDGLVQTAPRVAALRGGDLAVLHQESGPSGPRLMLSWMSGVGPQIRFSTAVAEGRAGLRDGALLALADGGLLIAWIDVADATLSAQVWSAAGEAGETLTVAAAASDAASPALTLLADGRAALVWREAGALRQALLDPRDPALAATAPAIGGSAAAHALGGTLDGSPRADLLYGSDHADLLRGGFGDDRLLGGGGADALEGGGGADTLEGGEGDDRLEGGAGADALIGGPGADMADYARAPGAVTATLGGAGAGGEAAGDVLSGIENLRGSAFADDLTGDAGDNRIEGGGGGDRIAGGAGTDIAVYAGSAGGVSVSLAAGSGAQADAEGDRLEGIEGLVGSAHADALEGDAGDNLIEGGGGDDVIFATAGADEIDGGSGEDALSFARLAAGVQAETAPGGLRLSWSGWSGVQSLRGIERLIGSDFADSLPGALAPRIEAMGGDDLLRLEDPGQILLSGGAGADVIEIAAEMAAAPRAALDGGTGEDALRPLGAAAGGGPTRLDLAALSGFETLDLSAPGLGTVQLLERQIEAGIVRIIGPGDGAASEPERTLRILMAGAPGTEEEDGGAEGDGALDLSTLRIEADPDRRVLIEIIGAAGIAETLRGGDGRERVTLGAGDAADLGAGDDVVRIAGAAVAAEGGAGRDMADFSEAAEGIALAAEGGGVLRVWGGAARGTALSGFEILRGGAFDDYLALGAGIEEVEALSGRDLISAQSGGALRIDAGADDDVIEIFAALSNDGAVYLGGGGEDALRIAGAAAAGETAAFALPDAVIDGIEALELRLMAGAGAALRLSAEEAQGFSRIALLGLGAAALEVEIAGAEGLLALPGIAAPGPLRLVIRGDGTEAALGLSGVPAGAALEIHGGAGDDRIIASGPGLYDGGEGADALETALRREQAALLRQPGGDWIAVTPEGVLRLRRIETIDFLDGASLGLTDADAPAGGEADPLLLPLPELAAGFTLLHLGGGDPAAGATVFLTDGRPAGIAQLIPGTGIRFTPDPGALDPLAGAETAWIELPYRIADAAGDAFDGIARLRIIGEDDPAVFDGPLEFIAGEGEAAPIPIPLSDPDGGPSGLAIAGGADAALFRIEDDALVFLSAPDHGAPADADGDNVYELELSLSAAAAAPARVTVAPTFGGPPIGEIRRITLTDAWTALAFDNSYVDPMVFALSPSFNEPDAAATRLRNVTGSGAEIRLQETLRLLGEFNPDRSHAPEEVTLLVLEKGVHVLEDGALLEVGSLLTNKLYVKGFDDIAFAAGFDAAPAVFSQVQSFDGTDWIVSRQRNADADGFQLTMQEEEFDNLNHAPETVGWFAITPGTGMWSGMVRQAGSSAQNINQHPTFVPFHEAFAAPPSVIASMATYQGTDPASPRISEVRATGFFGISVEDQSLNAEVQHGYEAFDWLALSGEGDLHAMATLTPAGGGGIATEGRARGLAMQTGVAEVSDRGARIALAEGFEDPLIFATLAGGRGTDPALARVEGVSAAGFTLSVAEVDDDPHLAEPVFWVAVEAGAWRLDDGTQIEAGRIALGADARAVEAAPEAALFAQTQTAYGPGLLHAALSREEDGGAQLRLQAEEGASPTGDEIAAWLSVSAAPGGGALATGRTNASGGWSAVSGAPSEALSEIGMLAGLTSAMDPDPAWARLRADGAGGVEILAQEDRAADAETAHGAETAEWLAFETGALLFGDPLL